MEDKLKQIVAEIFQAPEEEITDESSTDTIENWDSLQHLSLVLALEEEFGISLLADEVVKMVNVGEIRSILKHHGVI